MAFFLPWFGCRPHRFSAFGSILAQEQGRQQQRNPSAWNLFLPRRGFGERGTFRRHNKSRPYPTNQASEQQRVIANSQSLLRFFRDQFSILGAADTDSPGSSVHGTDLGTVSERASVGAESRLVRARGRKFGTTKRMYQKNRGRRRRPVICECLEIEYESCSRTTLRDPNIYLNIFTLFDVMAQTAKAVSMSDWRSISGPLSGSLEDCYLHLDSDGRCCNEDIDLWMNVQGRVSNPDTTA